MTIKQIKKTMQVIQEIEELINCGAFVDMRHDYETKGRRVEDTTTTVEMLNALNNASKIMNEVVAIIKVFNCSLFKGAK